MLKSQSILVNKLFYVSRPILDTTPNLSQPQTPKISVNLNHFKFYYLNPFQANSSQPLDYTIQWPILINLIIWTHNLDHFKSQLSSTTPDAFTMYTYKF